MKDGSLAGEEIKRAVLEACNDDERRPLSDLVYVRDAEIVKFDVTLTYYLQTGRTRSAADVSAAVKAAVDEYVTWQNAKLGRDINPSQLIWLLMQTGIKRVELTSPAFTALRDGSDRTTPQVAQVGTITITNGGYEDE